MADQGMCKAEITVIPWGGLCNRLNAIASAAILAEHRKCSWEICWQQHPFECSESMGMLFPELAKRTPVPPPDVSLLPLVAPSPAMECPPLGTAFAVRSLHIFRDRDMTREEWNKRYVAFLSRLAPSDLIRSRMLDLPQGTTGIHIRRTDHRPATFQSPLQLFTTAIDRRLDTDPGSVFFLTTDCRSTRAYLNRRYAKRILIREGGDVGRTSPTGIIEAAADLWTLASADNILCCSHSTFGRTAATIAAKTPIELKLPWFSSRLEKDPINRELDRWLRWEQEEGKSGEWRVRPISEQPRSLLRPVRRPLARAINAIGCSPIYQNFPWSRVPGVHVP